MEGEVVFDEFVRVAQAGRHSLVRRPDLRDVAPPPAERSWFWSSQYGRYLQHAGEHGPGDVLIRRSDPFAAFFLADDVLTAVTTVDNGRDLRRAMKLLGTTVRAESMADPTVDLRSLA